MKKIYLSIIQLLAFAGLAFAQPSNGTVVPDFTVTDINGTSHNLYSYLNSGKTVVIDYFATWCSICWSYHNTANRLKTLYNNHGPSGAAGVIATTTNDVVVIKMEIDVNTPTSQITFAGQNWTTGTNYPIVDLSATNSVPAAFNATSQSKVFIIYPNKVVENVSTSLTDAQLYAKVTTFLSINDKANNEIKDLKINSFFTKDGFTLQSNKAIENLSIEVYNLLGEKIINMQNIDIVAGKQSLPLISELKSNQVYFLKYKNANINLTQKLVN
jgi:thiol-disulfide isomerase/thioredoxin